MVLLRELTQQIPPPAAVQTPLSRIAEFHEGVEYLDGKEMSTVVAAGPYTLASSLDFEPLDDLLAYAVGTHADVLILVRLRAC